MGDVGITKLECNLDGQDVSSLNQVALQTSGAVTLKITRIYLVKAEQGGQEYERKELALTGGKHVLSSEFDGYPDSYKVVLTISTGGNDRNGWGIGCISRIDHYEHPSGHIDFNGKSGNTFELEFTIGDLKNAAKEGGSSYVSGDGGRTGVTINTWNGCSLVKVEVVVPVENDPFLGKKASGADSKTETKDVAKSAKKYTLENLSAAEYANVKYARIYVANSSGQALDFTGKLKVTYDGATTNVKDAGAKAKNGKYIYTGADLELSKIKVKIGEVEAGTLPNYQIVCLLANNTTGMTDDGVGTITHEPDWGYEYVVKFQSPARFTHYKGCTGRDYEVMSGATEPGVDTWEDGIISKSVRQSVHTVEYDIYVKEGGMALLELPFQNAWSSSGYGNSNEPREYIRWYDWNTDYAVEGSAGTLNPLNTVESDKTPEFTLLKDRFTDNGKSRGLMAWFLDRRGFEKYILFGGNDSWKNEFFFPPHKTNVAVTKFFRPSDAAWKQTDVACDVSRYRDGMNTTTYALDHEPTLSVRYIWHIHPAEEIAEKIKSTLKVKSDGLHPLEDGGTCSIGLKDGQAMANLHTELQDIDDYYFYNYDEANNTWGSTMYRAENLMWRVYTPDRQYYHDFYASDILYHDIEFDEKYDDNGKLEKRTIKTNVEKPYTNKKVYTEAEVSEDAVAQQLARDYPDGMYTRFFKFVIGQKTSDKEYVFRREMNATVYWLSDVEFTPVAGGATKKYSFKDGDKVPIFAYVTDKSKSNKAPVLRTDMWLQEGSQPVLFSSLGDDAYKERNLEWLENNMKHVGSITFDAPTGITKRGYTEVSLADGNFNAPTNPVDNMYDKTLSTESGHYGFCYPQLRNQSQVFTYAGITPFHGEYGLFKAKGGTTFDDGGPDQKKVGSGETETYYCWYEPGELHDRTTDETNGAKHGYFLYVDASDESRAITSIPFEANLCAGSSLVFTAAVANMTTYEYLDGREYDRNGGLSVYHKITSSPQVLFKLYGVDGTTGKKELLQSFTSGDFNASGAMERVKWYQVYAKTELSASAAQNYEKFELVVDNYCDNTDGADYAIDDVRVYTSSAQLLAVVTNDECDAGDETKLKITVNAFDVLRRLGNPSNTTGKNLFYRIFERSDDDTHTIREKEAMKGTNFYSDGANGDVYGVVPFEYNSSVTYPSALPAGTTSGFYKDGETLYFQIADQNYALPAARKYFVSIYSITQDHPGDTQAESDEAAGWGCPYEGNECTVYSNDFIPKRMYIELKEGGTISDGRISIDCETASGSSNHDYTLVLKVPTAYGGIEEFEGVVTYDFYVGSREDYLNETYNGKSLRDELKTFRSHHSTGAYTKDNLPADAGEVITKYVNDGLLKLNNSDEFRLEVGAVSGEETRFFVAEPVQTLVNGRSICTSMEFKFYLDNKGNTPLLKIGFDDVDYPDNYEQVVRVGLEQLDKMTTSNEGERYILHIPFNDYHDKAQGTDNHVEFEDDELMLYRTNDPTFNTDANGILQEQTVFAKVVNPDGSEGDGTKLVNNSRMYLPLDLSYFTGKFHEGYYYEVVGQYFDATHKNQTLPSDNTKKVCRQDLSFIVKVVPKYVTWKSKMIAEDYYNANWCYDENWERSERDMLYKEDYVNNGEGHLNGLTLGSNPGFVPMKFTYVTIPESNHAPDLNNLDRDKEVGTPQTGGDLINPSITMLTSTSPTNASNTYSSNSTTDIKYDMMVRYGTDSEGEGCKGHNHRTSRTEWNRIGNKPKVTARVFDCEKYMGNTCKEIYFKPSAELIHQERLHYEKAWVEKKLMPNQWYLMSAPLRATYAGDMYVPYSETAAKNGRQETEAFKDIEFDVSNGYSRTKYPIYQHAWGNTNSWDSPKVFTTENDIRKTNYSASIGEGANTWNTENLVWSHTFDDVQVPYTTINAFSIRANRKSKEALGTGTLEALLRLPKKDTAYEYFKWDGTSHPDPDAGRTILGVDKPAEDYGKLVADINQNPTEITLDISKVQTQDGYVLIGNPYMASINMEKFFEENARLDGKYWVYDQNGSVEARTGTGKIRPLEAFFIKTSSNVTFKPGMCYDGNFEDVADNQLSPARQYGVTISAMNRRGSSRAEVRLDGSASVGFDSGEDVETLFDSNLADVPMVFTVAEQQALSIDARPTMDIVPFGVACAASDELVDVSVDASHLSPLASHLYLLDAVTGDLTEVGEGGTFTVQPNDYGRYFLTTRGDLTAVGETKATEGIVVSVRGKAVTVRSAQALKSVRVLTTGGAVVGSVADGSKEATVHVNVGGVYVVEAQTADSKKSVKVVVK